MKLRYIVCVLCILISSSAVAQKFLLEGRVSDSVTLKGIPYANIRVVNSTKKVETNINGLFSLSDLQPGQYELIVSCVGYLTATARVTIDQQKKQLTVKLREAPITLQDVVVRPDPDRAKYLKLFTDGFIGTSDNAAACKILNPDILDVTFDKLTNTLEASSFDFLKIENAALGYRLSVLLKAFRLDLGLSATTYVGKIFFEEMEGSSAELKRWNKNRLETYKGSMRHFYVSLIQNTAKKNGFEMHPILKTANIHRFPDSIISKKIKELSNRVGPSDSLRFWKRQQGMEEFIYKISKDVLTEAQLVKPSKQSGFFDLSFDENLYIASNEKHVRNVNKLGTTAKATILLLNKPVTKIRLNGVLDAPLDITYQGSSPEKIADLLPDDFTPGLPDQGL